MRKLLLFLPLISLLTACQSKKEICAQFAADMHSDLAAAKKLGIDISDLGNPKRSSIPGIRVRKYCAYYRR